MRWCCWTLSFRSLRAQASHFRRSNLPRGSKRIPSDTLQRSSLRAPLIAVSTT